MFVLVCYDIFDDRRRNHVAKVLEGFGERVQDSVFECHLRPYELKKLRARLEKILDHKADKIRYYPLCGRDAGNSRSLGKPRLTSDWTAIIA